MLTTISTALSALDFLIVDYKAPSPLHLVITPSILSKYNRVFSYVLRLTRIEAVVRGIWVDITKPNLSPSLTGRVPAGHRAPVLLDSDRSTQRALQSLAFEVRGLVGGISDFAFGTIQATHTTFRRAVDKVERVSKARERRETVDADDADDDDREPAWNLDSLMSLHAHFLDRVLESLFVRGPNEHLRRTIDDGVFGVVLRLGRKTKEWRRREGGPGWDVSAVQRDIRAMHHRLRSEATTLVSSPPSRSCRAAGSSRPFRRSRRSRSSRVRVVSAAPSLRPRRAPRPLAREGSRLRSTAAPAPSRSSSCASTRTSSTRVLGEQLWVVWDDNACLDHGTSVLSDLPAHHIAPSHVCQCSWRPHSGWRM